MHSQSTPSEERTRSLSQEVSKAINARPNRCGYNARDGLDYLRRLGFDAYVALGFMVEHDRWEIQIIEHAWLVIREDGHELIVDPTLPFLAVHALPTYFEGAMSDDKRPYPDFRNHRYKAAFQAAKLLAASSKHPYQEEGPYKRPLHVGRINWIDGLDAAEGRVSR